MMDLFNNYIEFIGDPEFAISMGLFVFSLVLLMGLLAKLLTEKKKGTVPTVATPAKAAPKTADGAGPPVQGVAVSSAPSSLEGVMMWEFDDGKKKKIKKSPPVVADKIAASVLPTPSQEPKILAASSSPMQERSAEKTLILAPKEVPAPVLSPVRESPPVSSVAEERPTVDFQMYEALIRRISVLETDLKKEPLFLAPLMKRIGKTEKRLEEMGGKAEDGTSSAPGAGDERSLVLEKEVKELKNKVLAFQTILERVAEGSSTIPHP